jgi:hypothetical protein
MTPLFLLHTPTTTRGQIKHLNISFFSNEELKIYNLHKWEITKQNQLKELNNKIQNN